MGRRELERDFVEVMHVCEYGSGLSLSPKALERYRQRTGRDWRREDRDDPEMVRVVRELGPEAHRFGSEIRLARIPESYKDYWAIDECDGMETVCIRYREYKLEAIRELVVAWDHLSKRDLKDHILFLIEEPDIEGIPGAD